MRDTRTGHRPRRLRNPACFRRDAPVAQRFESQDCSRVLLLRSVAESSGLPLMSRAIERNTSVLQRELKGTRRTTPLLVVKARKDAGFSGKRNQIRRGVNEVIDAPG